MNVIVTGDVGSTGDATAAVLADGLASAWEALVDGATLTVGATVADGVAVPPEQAHTRKAALATAAIQRLGRLFRDSIPNPPPTEPLDSPS
jgi:hypothetical protein